TGHWFAYLLLEARPCRCAALDDAFHHRGDLISSHRIQDLLAPIDQRGLRLVFPFFAVAADAFTFIVLVDGMAVTILDTVDQCRLNSPTAIVEHCVSGGHA